MLIERCEVALRRGSADVEFVREFGKTPPRTQSRLLPRSFVERVDDGGGEFDVGLSGGPSEFVGVHDVASGERGVEGDEVDGLAELAEGIDDLLPVDVARDASVFGEDHDGVAGELAVLLLVVEPFEGALSALRSGYGPSRSDDHLIGAVEDAAHGGVGDSRSAVGDRQGVETIDDVADGKVVPGSDRLRDVWGLLAGDEMEALCDLGVAVQFGQVVDGIDTDSP
ncbi:hypothetical protein ET495_17305 (plasmid) [Xylanimonas allomyrinae]|uniref:Uncharacterized protein n=1 Tax=Xylanimonas allomyrinae TaxID=2509459 RepID=A0A4P6ETL8_9MICO|nr:hypothetical protein [Xylanimonas allomyrinae]QAY64979.1 hypothetical protein ET495_17305 [Xylanimonas allomyrinae]